jgi:hypothetical protein
LPEFDDEDEFPPKRKRRPRSDESSPRAGAEASASKSKPGVSWAPTVFVNSPAIADLLAGSFAFDLVPGPPEVSPVSLIRFQNDTTR